MDSQTQANLTTIGSVVAAIVAAWSRQEYNSWRDRKAAAAQQQLTIATAASLKEHTEATAQNAAATAKEKASEIKEATLCAAKANEEKLDHNTELTAQIVEELRPNHGSRSITEKIDLITLKLDAHVLDVDERFKKNDDAVALIRHTQVELVDRLAGKVDTTETAQ